MFDKFDPFSLIPFAMTASSGAPKLSGARLLEALIIAGIAGAISVYATQLVLGERLEAVQHTLERVDRRVERLERDFYVPRGTSSDARAVREEGST